MPAATRKAPKAEPTPEPEKTPATTLPGKLVEVMQEIGHVPKRGHNSFHNYDYATEADIVDAVREKLADRGVLLLCSLDHITEQEAVGAKGKPTRITTAYVMFTFHDSETKDRIDLQWAGRGEDPSDKGLYKALTGALKYFLMKSFLMPTGDDPEAAEHEVEAAGAPAQRAPSSGNQRQSKPPAPPVPVKAASAPPVEPQANGQEEMLNAALTPEQIGRLRETLEGSPKRKAGEAMLRGFGSENLEDLTEEQALKLFEFLQRS